MSTGSGSTSCSWLPAKLPIDGGHLPKLQFAGGSQLPGLPLFSTPSPPFFFPSILVKFMRLHVLIIKSFERGLVPIRPGGSVVPV
jgi:hypothetical protein